MRTSASTFRTSTVAAIGALAAMAVATPASAAIIGGTILSGATGATFVNLTVPFTQSNPDNTVGADTFQSINLFGFDEDQNIVLAAPLTVDFVPSGPTTLPSGTTVASHYIFFDPISGSIDGTVDFDSKVLAIITSTGNLAASDFLANTGVTYQNPSLRGIEAGDSVTISGLNQIRFATSAASPGDYVRVLTEYSPGGAVPEPLTMSLLALGLAAGAVRRQRARR